MSSSQRARGATSAPPAPTAALQTSASVPPALRASDAEETTYPSALPSALTDRFKASPCVMGTAVISRHYCQCECPHLDQFVVPVVKKRKEKEGEKEPAVAASAPSTLHGGNQDAQQRPVLTPSSHRRAVLQRGYIVFSDDYLSSHGESLVAQCQQRHEPGCECRCCRGECVALPVTDHHPSHNETHADSDSETDVTEKVDRCIEDAENYHLPLFRRKPSKLVYGEGTYVACGYNTGLTEPPVCVTIPKSAADTRGKSCCVSTPTALQGGARVVLQRNVPDCVNAAFDSAEL